MLNDDKVWRYLSLSRFIWLIQKQKLWLARVDTLEDVWELAIVQNEIEYLESRKPLGAESVTARAKRVSEHWRTTTFVNCWCAQQHESYALWRIFCGPHEGIALRTSWLELKNLSAGLSVDEVSYGDPTSIRTPRLEKVAFRKRQMFDYEHEVRIMADENSSAPGLERGEFGVCLPIDIGHSIHRIVVHPDADESFMEAVRGIVDKWLPTLVKRVEWSGMRERPPAFRF